jgi:hypothetical protein
MVIRKKFTTQGGYSHLVQIYKKKNKFYYLLHEKDLKELIIYKEDMIFDGKAKFGAEILSQPMIFISFKQLTEDRDYIFSFLVQKHRFILVKTTKVAEIFSLSWQDLDFQFLSDYSWDRNSSVMNDWNLNLESNYFFQKIELNLQKKFSDRFGLDWLYGEFEIFI